MKLVKYFGMKVLIKHEINHKNSGHKNLGVRE